MQTDPDIKTDVPATKERKVNKAEKLAGTKREKKQPNALIGHLESIALDLAADPARALTFTLAPKTGAKRVITVEATGEARQTAVAMLLAAKFEGKKLTVTLNEPNGSVARMLEFKSKARGK
jgi:hypothetical protein